MTASPYTAPDQGLLRSAVCHLDAEAGRLTYRGFDVSELAEWSSFEETSWLLVAGSWPQGRELSAFRRAWHTAQKLPPAQRKMLRSAPLDADELTVLRTAVSALPLEGAAIAPDLPVAADAMRLLGRVPALVAERLRLRRGGEAAPRWGRDGVAAGFLRVATGKEPHGDVVRAFDGALVLRADNELNPGTYAARVAASTGSDLTACVVSAMGALAGPKHSGHTIAVARLLHSVRSPAGAAEVVRQALGQTGRLAGFGHPVYRGEDPRTRVARELALLASQDDRRLIDLALQVEAEVQQQAGLRPNVDYYLTVIYLAAGLPVAAFAPIFAVARTPGWIAHVLEQRHDPELIRPRARYDGPIHQQLPARRRRARSAPAEQGEPPSP